MVSAMTRATKQAGTKAIPLLATAIENMSMQDAKGILSGGETAATEYFRRPPQRPTRPKTPAHRHSGDGPGAKSGPPHAAYRPVELDEGADLGRRTPPGRMHGVHAAGREQPLRQQANEVAAREIGFDAELVQPGDRGAVSDQRAQGGGRVPCGRGGFSNRRPVTATADRAASIVVSGTHGTLATYCAAFTRRSSRSY